MATYSGQITSSLIIEDRDFVQVDSGVREYRNKPASTQFDIIPIHGVREYAVPKGEYLEGEILQLEKRLSTPRQTPLEVSWKKAVFRDS